MGDIQTFPMGGTSSLETVYRDGKDAGRSALRRPNVAWLLKTPSSSTEEMVEVKEPALEEAKQIIADYFIENDGREIDYIELFEELNIDLQIIVAACAELEAENKIG